jgi:branched-chain amino acid aminotransferase
MAGKVKIWFQNKLCDARKARVSVYDHGYLYGDGIYETVHAYQYKVFHWDGHFQRLKNSARRIALRIPWSSQTLLNCVIRVLRANQEPYASVRITISRGPGPLGLDPSLCPDPTLVMLLHPARDFRTFWAKGVNIGIVSVRRNPPEALDPQIKSNNSLNTILAKMESKRMQVFEGVLTNLQGYLTEGTTSNLFFVKRGKLLTPALSCGLLAGITREAILRIARQQGIQVREGRYRPSDLLGADEVFLSSTTLEVVPIIGVKLAGHRHTHRIGSGHPGVFTRWIHALFGALVEKELKLRNRWESR